MHRRDTVRTTVLPGAPPYERALRRLCAAVRDRDPIEREAAARAYGAVQCRAGLAAAARAVAAHCAEGWRRQRPGAARQDRP